MALNDVVSSERIHIGFFGLRNAGKSSLVNAFTNQEIALVSDVKGTTTDAVKKSMEILPLGPCLIIDTPGIDDEGELGIKRVEVAKRILEEVDIAILVVDSSKMIDENNIFNVENNLSALELELIKSFEDKDIPYIIVFNKVDTIDLNNIKVNKDTIKDNYIFVSSTKKINIVQLREKVSLFGKDNTKPKYILKDIINTGDDVILVIPIDESAPKGRLILPQQLVLREILDNNCILHICQDTELDKTLELLKNPPKLVITDSQVFEKVMKIVPENILLTSFSILMARYRGDLKTLVEGAKVLEELKDGDKVYISEACTHHRQCNDIGTVKLPKWIENKYHIKPEYLFTSGIEFPKDLSDVKLVIHCGGCMINEKEMKYRINLAKTQNIPIVNYGIAISYMNGILKRTLEPFKDVYNIL